MSGVEIDKALFWQRIQDLSDRAELWQQHESLCVVVGKHDETETGLVAALLLWLFQIEFQSASLSLHKKHGALQVHITASKKVVSILKDQLGQAHPDGEQVASLSFAVRKKNALPEAAQAVVDLLLSASPQVALLADANVGAGTDFGAVVYNSIGESALEGIDAAPAISGFFARKTAVELTRSKMASEWAATVLRKSALPLLQDALTRGTWKHADLVHKIAEAHSGNTASLKAEASRMGLPLSAEHLEMPSPPLVQSRSGGFDLSPRAASNSARMNVGSGCPIVVNVASRFDGGVGMAARTLLVSPTERQRARYRVLLRVYVALRQRLKKGECTGADLFATAQQAIRQHAGADADTLLAAMCDNVGWTVGPRLFDERQTFAADSDTRVVPGTVLVLSVGFAGLSDPSSEEVSPVACRAVPYALLVRDTLYLSVEEGDKYGEPVLCTRAPLKLDEISYSLDTAQEDVDVEQLPSGAYTTGPGGRRRSKRNAGKEVEMQKMRENEVQRQRKQKRLIRERCSEMIEQLNDPDVTLQELFSAKRKKEWSDPVAYAGPADLPVVRASAPKLYVDMKRNALLAPINGAWVPFHVSIIRDVKLESVSETLHTLRISFVTPGLAGRGGNASALGGTEQQVALLRRHQSKVFVRELTFRSEKKNNLEQALKAVRTLQKRLREEHRAQDAREDLVKQAKIQLWRGDRSELAQLRDVTLRPSLGSKKRSTGVFEAHTTGFRFQGHLRDVVDVLYDNVEAMFFQPADSKVALSVTLHLHLKKAILVGGTSDKRGRSGAKSVGKRTRDITVSYQVLDPTQDTDAFGRRGDVDGIQEEQIERKKRNLWNKKFVTFARGALKRMKELQKRGDLSDAALKFQRPRPELQFKGKPNKQMVDMFCTESAIVSFEDSPVVVMPVNEIEMVHFERVRFDLREFDAVIVWKDLSRPVSRIDAIPKQYIEMLKDYLNDADVIYFEGAASLQWTNVMVVVKKTLSTREGALAFFEHGGWSDFLSPEDEEEEEAGGGQAMASDSEDGEGYEPSGAEEADEEYGSEYDAGEESEAMPGSEPEDDEEDSEVEYYASD